MTVAAKDFYVYVHRRKSDGGVFYVGKGKNRRAWDGRSRNRQWKAVEKEHGFIAHIVAAGLSEPCAITLERVVISRFGVENLANQKLGGIGNSGWHQSESARQRIGEASRSRKPHPNSIRALRENCPREFTKSQRLKMSLAKKGKRRGPLPPHVRAKISRSHVGLRPSLESLAKMSASHVGQRMRENNNKFDPTVRVFSHQEKGSFVGTSYDLRTRYGIGAPCVRAIIVGRQRTAKGWSYGGVHHG